MSPSVTRGPRHPLATLAKEVTAFGAVGGVNFLIDVGVYQLMYDVLAQGALVSKVVSTTVTTSAAYLMHRHISFSHRGRIGARREYVRFLLLSGASLVLGLLIIGAVRYGAGRTDVLSLQIANVASIVLGAVFRFWSYRRWVFPAVDADAAATGSPDSRRESGSDLTASEPPSADRIPAPESGRGTAEAPSARVAS